MIILSWNVQKVNADKAENFSVTFGQVINDVVGNEPFVVIVYENKSHPEKVLNALGTGLATSEKSFKWIDTGGAASLRENVLIICGNGASCDDPVLFAAWHTEFTDRCNAMHEGEKAAVRANVARLAAARSTRASTAQARERRIEQTDAGSFRPTAAFRCPVEITVRCQDRQVRVLVLHAPGPGDGAEHEQPFAHVYAESIFHSAKGFDLVLGDFNLRTHGVESNGFVDQGVRLGATTKGRVDGRHTFSRLDRAYARPGFAISSALVSDGQDRELTDHHCLAVRVESRDQRLISDYFPFSPSPVRRQEVLFENRGRAFEAGRGAVKKRDISSREILAKKRGDTKKRQKRDRAEQLADRRGAP